MHAFAAPSASSPPRLMSGVVWEPCQVTAVRISGPGSQVCREADGYQPHLVSPEFGLRRLVQDAMDLIMEPTTTAVRRVHLLLVEAARRAAPPCQPAIPLAFPVPLTTDTAAESAGYHIEAMYQANQHVPGRLAAFGALLS